MVKHCPTCNRSSKDTKFYGEFCEYCYVGSLKKGLPKEIEVDVCRVCRRIRIGESYSSYSNTALSIAARKFFKGYDVKIISAEGNSVKALLSKETAYGKASFEYDFALSEKKTLCSSCGRKLSGYYEAVIQLRGNASKFASFSKNLRNYLEANDSFIAKEEEVDGGIDLFTGDKKLTAEFIKMNMYKATQSYTLWGMRRGKKVYRNVFAIRL